MTAYSDFEGIEELWKRQEPASPHQTIDRQATAEPYDILRQILHQEQRRKNSRIFGAIATVAGLGMMMMAIHFFATDAPSALGIFFTTVISMLFLQGIRWITRVPILENEIDIPLRYYLPLVVQQLVRRRTFIYRWLPIFYIGQFLATLAVISALMPEFTSPYGLSVRRHPGVPPPEFEPVELWIFYLLPVLILAAAIVATLVHERRRFARDEMPMLERAERLLRESGSE